MIYGPDYGFLDTMRPHYVAVLLGVLFVLSALTPAAQAAPEDEEIPMLRIFFEEESYTVGEQVNISAEVTANGRFVVDGSIPYYGVGMVREPVTFTIERGFVTRIDGGEQARFLDDLLAAQNDEWVYNVAQFAFGLNQACKEFTGEIYQTPPKESAVKKVLRTRRIHSLELLETLTDSELLELENETDSELELEETEVETETDTETDVD